PSKKLARIVKSCL
ncbi:hypothetical protein CP8484711_0715, partial [Chlamydia psittaci 84-8471/1]